jgi:OOP family OmpA-OmpF porin
MRQLRTLVLCLGIPAFISGCATTDTATVGGHTFSNIPCALIGAAIGAAAGGATASWGGAGMGLLGGAVMSQYFCGTEPEPVDTDGDWVPDEFDECPDTPKGVSVDGKGCPLDSDGDGVPDTTDQCPQVAGPAPTGCPEEAAEPVQEALLIENILFDFDKADIKPTSQAVLDARAVPLLKQNPDAKVTIVGHTDSTGDERYNEKLSLRRAESVRAYLLAQGIDEARLSIAGYGETQPIDTNDTREGRANNRRVEFVFRQ